MVKEETISQIKKGLALHHEIAWAYLYGSFLTEEKFEDLDIAVYLGPGYLKRVPSLIKEEQMLAISLEKMLSPRYEVDLKILNHAPIHFQYKILKIGKLIFFREPAEVLHYEGETISSYLDYKPTLEFFDKALLRRIDKW